MSTTMTAAGESLVARLQAEGKALVIDKMIFAHIPGQDHTKPIAPGVDVPTEPEGQVVHQYGIPPEYRAYVNPNQVVYSAMLGSDVGDFTFNWQGLYCTEHKTLVAVATFPALEKRKYDVATGRVGNNLTRNFLLTFTGAREITALTIGADVWQLDFTVRLLGMDERTRLSNFDLYGQGYFEGDGWLLKESAGAYTFTSGLGYVGGIRALLPEVLPLAVTSLKNSAVAPDSEGGASGGFTSPDMSGTAAAGKDVYLSVCLKPVGSDRVAEATAVMVDVGQAVPDTPDETGLMHYRQIVARVEEDGTVTDLRPKRMGGLPPDKVGAASCDLEIITGAGLSGGGKLTGDITLVAECQWHEDKDYPAPFLVFGKDGKIYQALQPSGPGVPTGVKEPGKAGSELFWFDPLSPLQSDAAFLHQWRKSHIGTAREWASIKLDPGYEWADRTAVYLDDYPEFKAKYLEGGFAGLVLPHTATQAEKDANLGKWVESADGLTLLKPDRRGQFVRGCVPGGVGEAGKWGRDEIQNITGSIAEVCDSRSGLHGSFNLMTNAPGAFYNATTGYYRTGVDFSASYQVPTGIANVPPHVWTPVGIYMGTQAGVPI